jgi:hypothetical protein
MRFFRKMLLLTVASCGLPGLASAETMREALIKTLRAPDKRRLMKTYHWRNRKAAPMPMQRAAIVKIFHDPTVLTSSPNGCLAPS